MDGWRGVLLFDETSATPVAERSAAGERRKRKLEETLLVEGLEMQGCTAKVQTFDLPIR